MIATPMLCPRCGELVVAWPDPGGRRLLIPAHPDAVMPTESCTAADRQSPPVTKPGSPR